MDGDIHLFYRFGVALFIGVLVGLQREYSYDEEGEPERRTFAGVRTFALFAISGASAALIGDLFASAWIFIGLLLALTVMIAVAYSVTAQKGHLGMTTEVAAVLTILAGGLCYLDQVALAVALGVATTALLSFKLELHGFVERITRADVVATLKFAIITAIVLPVLPNESFGAPPFDVLNPYKIWLMVVLISGINFLGYILIKLVGGQRGIGLTGLLGGLASSTATTLSFSQRSQVEQEHGKPFALAIIIAWTVMFARILVEVSAVNATLLQALWLPIVAGAVAGLVYGAYLYLAPGAEEGAAPTVSNPFELGPAVTFGLLYGVVLLAARTAQLYLGDSGIYVSSILSGLADVDAITLSMAELSRSGDLELPVAARAIVLAAMSNTVVKGGIVLTSGSAALRRAMGPGFAAILIIALSVAFLL